ncbi:MAG TPA: hypothetical protein VMR97_04825 [Acidimicrobiales bacterium]|nr:hypothetical protein [Acidimicrobiales bacterium]
MLNDNEATAQVAPPEVVEEEEEDELDDPVADPLVVDDGFALPPHAASDVAPARAATTRTDLVARPRREPAALRS